ncbi:hypothetical protein TYRP_015598 [Tyrophagus putrescentiae]|nr:hypothetical protein TYRP_015598 [Tyrophagus putrescentiae]
MEEEVLLRVSTSVSSGPARFARETLVDGR